MDESPFETTGDSDNLANARAVTVLSGFNMSMLPPHSAPSARLSRAGIAKPETDFDSANQRLTLVAMMAASLAVLGLTSESPRGEPSALAFADVGDSTSGIVVALAFGLWAAGCTAIRKTSRSRHR